MTLHGYMRVSTDEQSTDLQLDALTRAGVIAPNIHADDGVSGTKPAMQRPAFRALSASMIAGDTLVVYSLSRVGRSTLDVLGLLRELEARGIAFRSLTEGFDTSTPVGRLAMGMLAVINQFERDVLSERTKAGLAATRARGTRLGRPRKSVVAG